MHIFFQQNQSANIFLSGFINLKLSFLFIQSSLVKSNQDSKKQEHMHDLCSVYMIHFQFFININPSYDQKETKVRGFMSRLLRDMIFLIRFFYT